MCGCKQNCADCASKASNASGEFSPSEMAAYINKHIFSGQATLEEVQAAYPSAMLWIDKNGLPFNEETVASNADQIKAAINDPSFMEEATSETVRPSFVKDNKEVDLRSMGITVIACLVLLYLSIKYWN